MRDFLFGGNRSLYRFIRFHVSVFLRGCWQVLVLLVGTTGFLIRLIFQPQRRHVMKLQEKTKKRLEKFLMENSVIDIKTRNAYNIKRYVEPHEISFDEIQEHLTPIVLYFFVWKPILVLFYMVLIVYPAISSNFSSPSTSSELFYFTNPELMVVIYIISYILLAYLIEYLIDKVLIILFKRSTDETFDIQTPGLNERIDVPFVNRQNGNDRSFGAKDHELYCIKVPPPPFVTVSSSSDSIPGTVASAPADLPQPSRPEKIKKRWRFWNSTTSRPEPMASDYHCSPCFDRQSSPLDFTSDSFQRWLNELPPPSYSSLSRVPSETSKSLSPTEPALTSPRDNTQKTSPEDDRKRVNVPTVQNHQYDSFEWPEDSTGVLRAIETPLDSNLNTWLSPTGYETPRDLMYDVLSPQAARDSSAREFRPNQVFRSTIVNPTESKTTKNDSVHFLAYAPPYVTLETTFPFSIWAFLVNQREEMHEEARSAHDSVRQLSREVLLPVRRGALIHIHLSTPPGFLVLDDPIRAIQWDGSITNATFSIQCSDTNNIGPVMFEATIVVGSKVIELRSYISVASSDSAMNPEVEELVCELELLPETYQEIPYEALTFKELVGQGHFGDAYKAEYCGQEVVVKTIRADTVGIEEFRHEAAILNMFGHHPNIVPFVGASTDISQPLALVTAYLPFGSLESQVQDKNSMTVSQKEIILYDTAAGLLNIHEGGFVHRDIAARNVLVDSSQRGKICDFGLCRRINVSSGASFVTSGVGPLKYMAPETLQPPYTFSYPSDTFSFGVLMWETFSGFNPYQSMSALEAAAYVLEGGRLDANLECIPQQYSSLMERCFDQDPTKRPSLVELHHSFSHV